ncbi:tRNA-intron lyase [Candidatus Pacearchaeota archaeon]|nr:tRNA-intron lyase [Candidatus Pacearchaeota archaeon]
MKPQIKAFFSGGVVFSNSEEALALHEKSLFGDKKTKDRIQYTPSEVLYLIEKDKMNVFIKTREISHQELINKFRRIDKKIMLKYIVFKDLREKGYIVKTGLKFGAEFRVYEKTTLKKTQDKSDKHAKWLVQTEASSGKISWHDFSAKNRVAHSTRKKLLLALVDEEEDITYYEISWIRP